MMMGEWGGGRHLGDLWLGGKGEPTEPHSQKVPIDKVVGGHCEVLGLWHLFSISK